MAKKRIALINDDWRVENTVRIALKDIDHERTTYKSALAGIIGVRNTEYDCILLNNRLPMTDDTVDETETIPDYAVRKGGLDVLRRIRTSGDPNFETPVIVMTVKQDMEADYMSAGATEYMVKPFGPSRLKTTLNELL